MKKNQQFTDRQWSGIKKFIIVMKLTALFLFLSVMAIAAGTYGQETRFDLNVKDATIIQLFDEIEHVTEFGFLFKTDQLDLNRHYTLDLKKANIDQILNEVLDKNRYNYTVIDRNIVITLVDANAMQDGKTKSVTGKVTDASGATLPGVSVVLKGTTTGVITDDKGSYSLSNIPSNATLAFSFVGMKSQEIPVGGKTTINVTLEEEAIGIEEVVAIGYGSVKKSDLTGAVSTVKGETISNRKVTQLSQAIQGSTAGVMVTRDNNAPGATSKISIRGITTIGDSNPLVIVDGVPVDNINNINPNDIQDMSVLKDGASASIYGSRAAAGVILITTTRAKSGEILIRYDGMSGFEKPTSLPDYVDIKRYMQIVNELRWNDKNNNAGGEFSTYSKDLIDNYSTLNATDPNKYPNTDWVGLMLNKNAPRQSHTLDISGGTKSVRTHVSLGYDKTEALYEGRSYERLTARFNNDLIVNKYLSASVDFSFNRAISKQPNFDNVLMYYTLIAAPVYAAKWSDGRVADGKTGQNIYGQTKYGGYNNSWNNLISGKISIDFTPIDGLKISAILSPTLGFNKNKNFNLRIPYYAADNPALFVGTLDLSTQTNLFENRDDYSRVTSQLIANYVKNFKKHNLNLMAGYENYYAKNEFLGASRENYSLTSYPYLDLGPLTLVKNSGSAYENAYRSYVGRVMYNYANKYFLQGNIRYDGSSRFYKDYRWGSFPSFSVGWVLSEESFMKSVPAISFLKLRSSWGTLGNDRIGNYPYQASIGFNNALFFQGNNVASAQTAAQIQYAIKDISWETTESIDFGLDARFFNDRLSFTGDYYQKTTKDMLLPLQIPIYMGFTNPNQNTGKMNTKGWDVEIGWRDKIGDLGYAVSANISDFKSVMGDLGGTEFIGSQINKKGSEFNEWYGYLSDGLFQTDADLAASPKLNSAMKVGDVKYKDISGPNGVPDGKVSPEYDRTLLGGSLPRYLFGGNIQVDYKNFDFSVAFQGVGKVNSMLSGLMVTALPLDWGNVPKILDGTSWSKYNTDAQNLAAKYPRYTTVNLSNNMAVSDFWLINGAYLRVKNITLGYNIPSLITQKMKLQKVRVYVSTSDLLTLDKFPKGWDPEVSATGYPITASYVLGLSVTF